MNSKVKKQLIIGTIVILIIINISALFTIILHNRTERKHFSEEAFQDNNPRQQGMNYFLRNELNLNDDQYNSFQEINRTYFKKSRDIALELNSNRILMIEEIAKENPNLDKLDQIAKEIGNLHYELKTNTIDHFLELKSVCNDEQQIILQQFFLKLINDQDQEQFRRREGPGRERHGKKRNRP